MVLSSNKIEFIIEDDGTEILTEPNLNIIVNKGTGGLVVLIQIIMVKNLQKNSRKNIKNILKIKLLYLDVLMRHILLNTIQIKRLEKKRTKCRRFD